MEVSVGSSYIYIFDKHFSTKYCSTLLALNKQQTINQLDTNCYLTLNVIFSLFSFLLQERGSVSHKIIVHNYIDIGCRGRKISYISQRRATSHKSLCSKDTL